MISFLKGKTVIFDNIAQIPMIQHIIGLVETKIALVKLEVKEDISHATARLIVAFGMGALAFFIWFFISFAFAFLLNSLLDSSYLGFIIIAGIHIVLLLLLYIFQKELGLEKTIARGMDKILKIDQDKNE